MLYALTLSAHTLVFGISSYRSAQELIKEYQPIAGYLSQELNTTVVIKPLLQRDLERQIQEGKIDIILTNPTHLLWLRTQKKSLPLLQRW